MALGSIISSHVIRESLRYCAGGRGIRTGDIHLRGCDSLHARSCTCSRFACGVSPSGVLALSRTFGTPCASAPIPIPPSVMARWLCLTTGGTQPSNGNLGPPSLSPGRPARFSTSWNGRAGWLSDGLSSLRETLPDTPKRGFRSGRLGPGRSDPFFVTVCVSARWLLSLLTSVSGRPSQAAQGPWPLPVHLPARHRHVLRHTGGNLRCALPPRAVRFWRSLRQPTPASVAERSLRETLCVDRHVDPAGCVIPISDLA